MSTTPSTEPVPLVKRKPKPGDIGLVRIPGYMGWLIAFGQLLMGDASKYTHAFVVIDEKHSISASPGGAGWDNLETYMSHGSAFGWNIPLTPDQRAQIVAAAESLIGTPYSFLDYLALALHRFKIRPKFIEKRVTDSGHMICSQLVDQCYLRAGIHLFEDGRLSQDVTPGDLANVLIEAW